MYNDELEQLIDAALADGVLTDKEKQILFKKAESFGVDLDEFEMVLDARALKAQQAQQPVRPAKEKLGNIVTCPACGAHIPGGNAVCPECGHVFNNIEANSSVTRLNKRLEEVEKKYSKKEKKTKQSFWDADTTDCDRDDEMARVVNRFPIPNSRGDLLEFLPWLKSQAEMKYDGSNNSYIDACRAKYKECVLKARTTFQNDPAFAPYLKKETLLEKIKFFIEHWYE